jgi:predicted glycogen debranching enzyme
VVKEMLMPEGENSLLVRYTVTEAAEKINLQINPLVAFRSVHSLKKAGMADKCKITEVNNGIRISMLPGYDKLFMQTSLKSEFTAAPDWYYNFEYPVEQNRGYPYTEDLFAPGHLILSLKKGEKVVLYAGTADCNTKILSNRFTALLKKQQPLQTEEDCLRHAAAQFVVRTEESTRIKAGYHWFGSWGRDTFIALPGLLLATGDTKTFLNVIDSSLADLKDGLLPNVGTGKKAVYNSVDASLWFIWALQQYVLRTGQAKEIWSRYGESLKQILNNYRNGTRFHIHMDEDGLIEAGTPEVALTWMDAVVHGVPVTPRTGKAVEINALWYNAVCFCLDLAAADEDTEFVNHWNALPELIGTSFAEQFWEKEKGYLADCINDGIADWSFRPNQVFALSVPYSPVPDYLRAEILENIKDQLYTPKGLRTLSVADSKYIGRCQGNQAERDAAYHQGTVWPWLTGHFAEAWMREFKFEGEAVVAQIRDDFYAMIGDQCVNTIPEINNGDEPHNPAGAVAQAWSVAEAIRVDFMLTHKIKIAAMQQEGNP